MTGSQERALLSTRAARIATGVLLGAVIAYAALAFLTPVEDPDFWWHLATGGAMAAARGLVHHDPFSFASANAPRAREELILTSYWLAQLAYFGVHALGGMKGVILARAALLAAMFAVVYRRTRRLGVSRALAASLLAASIVAFASLYTGDRPQVFSFLGATLLVGMMERIREGERPTLLVLPLMALWSNLHGGFVVGDALLAAFAAGAVVQYRGDPRRMAGVVAWALGGIVISLANPNGYRVFQASMQLGSDPLLLTFVDEYMSTLELFRQGRYIVVLVWCLVAVVPLAMLAARRLYWPDLLLWAFTGAIAVRYTRNVAFFATALVPTCGYYLQHVLRKPRLAALAVPVQIGAGVAACALMASSAGGLLQRGSPMRADVGRDFPTAACAFLERNHLAGRVFDEYDWGGYLLWRLHPQSQVFIDGRLLVPENAVEYGRMLWGVVDEQRGIRVYRELLDSNRLDLVVLRAYMLLGNVAPLTLRLLEDPEWAPVYVDDRAVVFARGNALARGTPGLALTREEYAERLLRLLGELSTGAPGDFRPHLARAEMLEWLGRIGEARESLAVARRLAPDNPFVLELASRVEP